MEIGILLVFVYSLICATVNNTEFEVLLIKNRSIILDLYLTRKFYLLYNS